MSLGKVQSVLADLEDLKKAHSRGAGVEEAAIRLVVLTARFAQATTHSRSNHELARRATLYEELTGKGSTFDQARKATIRQAVAHPEQLYIPDLSAPPTRRRRQASIDSSWVTTPTHDMLVYPSVTPKVLARWRDPEGPRWNVPEALAHTDAFLQLGPKSRGLKANLQRWRDELWKVHARSEIDHLFGSYVILQCKSSLAGDLPNTQMHTVIVSRMSEDIGRFARLIQDAMKDVALTRGTAPTNSSDTATGTKVWYHRPDEQRPEAYKFGPLTANQKQLARAIAPSKGDRPNVKALISYSKNKAIYVVRLKPQEFEAWFRDETRFKNAKEHLSVAEEEEGG